MQTKDSKQPSASQAYTFLACPECGHIRLALPHSCPRCLDDRKVPATAKQLRAEAEGSRSDAKLFDAAADVLEADHVSP